jgi:hypothetical protein
MAALCVNDMDWQRLLLVLFQDYSQLTGSDLPNDLV